MRRVQSKCRGMGPLSRLGMPIFFPFPAFDCLFQSGPSLTHFDTLLTPVFLTACDLPWALSDSTDALALDSGSSTTSREQPGSQIPTHSIALLGLPISRRLCHPS